MRLEARLGYVHKGVNSLMRGATLERGALLAARVSGDSTVAYQFAFARAAEAALGVEPPARARWLRAALAELERLANHFGDIGAICNDASFSLMHAHCGIMRERVLRACAAAFGHRLMMDTIVPGGVAVDLAPSGREAIRALIANIREVLPRLVTLYDNTASLQDRTVRTGVLRTALAVEYGCGGYIGRASGRDFDARRGFPYSPYDELRFEVPLLDAGRCQREGLDSHPRGRTEPRNPRPDSRPLAGRPGRALKSPRAAGNARAMRWSRDFEAMSSSRCA